MAGSSTAEQPETPGNANSYPPASSTAAVMPGASLQASDAIPGISIQGPLQQPPAVHQQHTSSTVTEPRQRRRASKFDQPAGEPHAAEHQSLPPPPPLHSLNAQKSLTHVAAPGLGLSAQASLPLPGPPPAHSVSASESAESMRARAQAVAARFAAAAAAEEGSQAAEPAMPAAAQRPAGLQQPAAAASEFEDDADPFKGLPPLPAKSTPLPRPPRPEPAGLSFSSSKADMLLPAAAPTAAPSAGPLMPPPHFSVGMWPRPPQPPGGLPCGPPPRPISGPRPPPGPYPAHPPPQHYPSHLQVRQAGCGLSQCLCSAMFFAFFDSQAALCDSLECSLPDGIDRRGLVLQVPRAPHPLPGIPSWQGQPAGQPLLKMPGQPAWSHNQGAEALGQPASLCQSCSPCFDLATGLQQHTTILLPGSCACLLTELPWTHHTS